MHSTSNLTIEWVKPDIAAERWEFFHHPEKQGFYRRHAIGWEEILSGFGAGRLAPYPRSDRIDGIPVALSYSSYDDYARYLAKAKRGYRRNYSLMEETLQSEGKPMGSGLPFCYFGKGMGSGQKGKGGHAAAFGVSS